MTLYVKDNVKYIRSLKNIVKRQIKIIFNNLSQVLASLSIGLDMLKLCKNNVQEEILVLPKSCHICVNYSTSIIIYKYNLYLILIFVIFLYRIIEQFC